MMAEPCEECKECKDTRKIVSGMKDELHGHILTTSTKLDKHAQDINSLQSTTSNTYRTIEDMQTTMKEGFKKQGQRLTAHEEADSIEMEGLKKDFKAGIDTVLEAFKTELKPVKEMTDKNSSFIYKLTVRATTLVAVIGGGWWLHSKGLMIISLPGAPVG
jgi:methylthioribose-1-phosphate isomerase